MVNFHQNAKRKLNFQCRRQCFARGTLKRSSFQETEAKSSNKIPKTKHACIVEAHESTRQRLESSQPKDHENHIAGKGYNSMTHHKLVHKFIRVPPAMKIPSAKAAVDKEWKNSIQSQFGSWTKLRAKRSLFWMHTDKKKVHFATLMDICHLKKCGVRTTISEVSRSRRTPR